MDASHVHPEFRHVLNLSAKERIEFMGSPRWVGYAAANLIIEKLNDLLATPKRPRMPNLIVVSESNNGKTTIIRNFMAKHGNSFVDEDGATVKPIALVESPPSADEKGFYISILETFYTTYRASDPCAKLRYQVIHLFRSCRVRMLVIDEFHSLLTGSAIKQREVMNAIKLLCNELGIPIVGVGTHDSVRILHMDPQHASRFDVVKLPKWELNKDLLRLLLSFEQILPLKHPSNLSSPETAQKLLLICDGNLGNLHRLLVECARTAIQNGTERITTVEINANSWVRPTRGLREIAL
jgi:Bacterial TniB protein